MKDMTAPCIIRVDTGTGTQQTSVLYMKLRCEGREFVLEVPQVGEGPWVLFHLCRIMDVSSDVLLLLLLLSKQSRGNISVSIKSIGLG